MQRAMQKSINLLEEEHQTLHYQVFLVEDAQDVLAMDRLEQIEEDIFAHKRLLQKWEMLLFECI